MYSFLWYKSSASKYFTLIQPNNNFPVNKTLRIAEMLSKQSSSPIIDPIFKAGHKTQASREPPHESRRTNCL